jgi:Holliday junction resolvase RusA-like endonuclease
MAAIGEPLIIELPGPVRGKGRPRLMKATGIAFTDSKTRSYEAQLKFAAVEVMAGRAPIEGPLRVTLVAYFPIAPSWPKKKQAAAQLGDIFPTSKPDGDNILKLCDALNQVVWRDDSQIVDALVLKRYGQPKLVIRVEPVRAGGAA